MLYFTPFLLANAALCFGAWRLGARHDRWALLPAPFLIAGAWYVVLHFDLRPVPGSTVGSAIIATVAWYVGALCVVLTLALLLGSWRARRSPVVAAVALGLVAPALLALGYRVKNAGRRETTQQGEPIAAPPTARDSLAEGYAWAIDNGVETDAGCTVGGASFIEGCRRAVHRGGR